MKLTKQTATSLLTAGMLAIAATMNATNPFLSDYNTPFNIPPFERITENDYMPALKAACSLSRISPRTGDTKWPFPQ